MFPEWWLASEGSSMPMKVKWAKKVKNLIGVSADMQLSGVEY